MVDVTTYDPKKVSIVVNNRMITGFASDSMITVARSEILSRRPSASRAM